MVRTLAIALGIVSVSLAGCQPDEAGAKTATPSSAAAEPAPVPAATPTPQHAAELEPAQVVRKAAPVAPNLSPTVAEVVRLYQAGIEESVLLAFVQNSTNAVAPSSDELVYLSDLGVPSSVMKAMLNRGAELQKQTTVATTPPVQVPAPAPAPVSTTPVPVTTAPEVAAPTVVVVPAPTTTTVVVPVSAPQEVVYFYEPLASYGSWMELPDYGWCWQPSVAVASPGWRPYSDRGRWIYTDCGWYWQSDYTWGWAPFHYGRWAQHHRHGWIWVPDTTWSAAWVSWRNTDTHCGWAPLPPSAHYVHGRGLVYNNVTAGIDCDFGLSSVHFTFISKFHFLDRNPNQFFVRNTEAGTFYSRSTVINNYTVINNNTTVVNGGMSARHLTEVTHNEVRKVTVQPSEDTALPARPDRVNRIGSEYVIYRPRLQKPQLQPAKPVTAVKDTAVGGLDKTTARISISNPEPVTPPAGQGKTERIERLNDTRKQNELRTGGIAAGVPENLKAPQPVTSAPRPLAPPQPVTSTPDLLAPPQPITSAPQTLTPPRPVTSTPQLLAPAQPITSTADPVRSTPQLLAPPKPVASVPPTLTAPEPVRSTPQSPTAPAHPATQLTRPQTQPNVSQNAKLLEQARPTTTRETVTTPARQPTYTAPSQPAYTPSQPKVSTPASTYSAPSYSAPSRPAPPSTPAPAPAPAPRAEPPRSQPSPAAVQQLNDAKKSQDDRKNR